MRKMQVEKVLKKPGKKVEETGGGKCILPTKTVGMVQGVLRRAEGRGRKQRQTMKQRFRRIRIQPSFVRFKERESRIGFFLFD